jgi:hypothetical protein
VTRDS